MESRSILYVEDEEDDVFFLKIAFQKAGSPHTLTELPDGEQAIEYLAGKGPFADRACHPLPILVLLDINIPKKSGLEVLEWIREQPCFETLPVLMLTSSSRPEDLEKARLLGANDYLLKPSDPRTLVDAVKSLHDRWLSQPAISGNLSSTTSPVHSSSPRRLK
jgi:CheY-like chemotaxis protein